MTEWQLLGSADDLPGEDDWFLAELGGDPVFVQRVGDGFVCYDNVCPHQNHPLRLTPCGSGPLRCPVHHWAFDSATGRLVFVRGMAEAELHVLDADLRPIELRRDGVLLFGRR